MLSWGVADFLAKKAIDKIGYKTSLVLNQVVAFVPVVIFAVFFFKLPLFSPEFVGSNCFAGITGVHRIHFLVQRFPERQRVRSGSNYRKLVSHNNLVCSSLFSRKH